MSNFARRPQNYPLNLAHQIAWERAYQELLREFLTKFHEFDGSAVATWMRSKGLHDPDHHNQWASQIAYYARAGWYEFVERGIPTGKAHIATVCVWRSRFYKGK